MWLSQGRVSWKKLRAHTQLFKQIKQAKVQEQRKEAMQDKEDMTVSQGIPREVPRGTTSEFQAEQRCLWNFRIEVLRVVKD